MTPPRDRLLIVGAGRVGLALGLLLAEAGAVASLMIVGRRDAPPAHPLFTGDQPRARYLAGIPEIESLSLAPTGVLIAVPDGAVADVARRLAARGVPPGVPVLHLSGTVEVEALAPLARAGCAVGALHPLAAVPDPVAGAERLRGAWFGVEAEGEARALAERIVVAAGGRALHLRPGARPLYHAAAVFASNYLVALLAISERLMRRAGITEAEARAALTGLAGGALAGVAEVGPAAALTGPIARGDAATVALHLARLSGAERDVYCLLGQEALRLARGRADAPDAGALARIEQLLGEQGERT